MRRGPKSPLFGRDFPFNVLVIKTGKSFFRFLVYLQSLGVPVEVNSGGVSAVQKFLEGSGNCRPNTKNHQKLESSVSILRTLRFQTMCAVLAASRAGFLPLC